MKGKAKLLPMNTKHKLKLVSSNTKISIVIKSWGDTQITSPF